MILFLAFWAQAQATPAQVIVVPTKTNADLLEVRRITKKRIGRPDLEWLNPTIPANTGEALQRYPNECTPNMPKGLENTLATFGQDQEIFVVLPATDRAKEVSIWRYDHGSTNLNPVLTKHRFEKHIILDVPARVFNIPWPDHDVRPIHQKGLATIGRLNPTIVDGHFEAELVKLLAEHPFECWPELSGSMKDALQAEQAKTPETDLYLALNGPKSSPFIWRWDNDEARLSRTLRY